MSHHTIPPALKHEREKMVDQCFDNLIRMVKQMFEELQNKLTQADAQALDRAAELAKTKTALDAANTKISELEAAALLVPAAVAAATAVLPDGAISADQAAALSVQADKLVADTAAPAQG